MRLPRPRSISFTPFLEELKTYNYSTLRADLLAALAVALMTIPQSIAYSLLAGLPPTAGLYSAIFGTIFTATFGSSRHLISGPSTGIAILLQTSISDVLYTYYGSSLGVNLEALVLHILMQFVVVMGCLQIGAAFFNVAKLLQFVSRPVVLGYFGGISIAIVITQVFSLTGVPPPLSDQAIVFKAVHFFFHLAQTDWPTLLVGSVSLVSLLLLRRLFKNWPNALIMLIGASFFALALKTWLQIHSIVILDSFQIPSDPIPDFGFPLIDLKLISKIFPAAIAVSCLAILEVFSISRTFATKAGKKTQINQDIFALGVGNLVLSFFGGSMPASGSATRTSLNFRLGAKTRGAAIFSGLFTATIVLFCWPLVKMIPLAALAALLIATVHTLTDWREITFSLRATREDAWVFLLTFLSCLFFNLDVAFFIGILISIGTYLKKSATPHLVEYAFNSKGRLITINPKDEVYRKVRIIGIGGDLYFATADVFEAAIESIAEDRNVQAIVLRLNNVYHMDASMCLAILHLYENLKMRGCHLVISGLTEEVWHVFHRAGLVKQIGLDNLYFTDESNPQFSTWKACLRAQELVHKQM
jgi:SulP family sulfate permease